MKNMLIVQMDVMFAKLADVYSQNQCLLKKKREEIFLIVALITGERCVMILYMGSLLLLFIRKEEKQSPQVKRKGNFILILT
jgi:hypothetical protein